jgi:hypothetical protein
VRGLKPALAAGIVLLTIVPAASANTYEVTRHNDPTPGACQPSDCSLREAVLAANEHSGGDVVLLPDRGAPYKLSRANPPGGFSEQEGLVGDLDVTEGLVVRHGGEGMATIDAQGVDRVVELLAGALTVKRIRLTGGVATLTPARARRGIYTSGGGAYNSGPGKLTLDRSVVAGNEAESGGGLESFGERLVLTATKVSGNEGGGARAGNITVTRSVIRGNRGYGLYVHENADVAKSTVAGNQSFGVSLEGVDATLRSSTISGNRGGGIDIVFASDVSITNSTVTRNRTEGSGGGIDIDGSIDTATLLLNSVTVANNIADADDDGFGDGGGIRADMASVDVVNSIISRNRVAGAANDCFGSFDSDRGNLLSTTIDCTGFEPGSGDFIAANPKLGALKRNGGPTKTRALKAGSKAIGRAIAAASPTRDQRGVSRDAHPDIGAFER